MAPLILLSVITISLLNNNIYDITVIYILVLIAIVCLLLAVIWISRLFLKIGKITHSTLLLSSGVYPSTLKLSGNDEVSVISKNLDALVTDLKAKADFTTQISAGNLDAAYHAPVQNDTLSSALTGIRERLIKVKSEEQQRTWANTALGKFVEILRGHHDLKDLSNDIVINLVQTLNANQGAIFIVTKDESGVEYLNMEACYAFKRTKHFSKRIEVGEGVIGQAYLEKETVYLKNIPQNFVRITSGLGDANPTSLLVIPLKLNDVVVGIIELAAFQDFAKYEIEFAEKIGESIAHAMTSFRVSEHTKTLLKEAEQRAEEMKAQEEELRQNQEELEATQEEVSRKYNVLFSQLKELNHESKFDQLLSITFSKKRNVEYYFDIIRNQIITFAEDKMVIDAVRNLTSAFYKIDGQVAAKELSSIKEQLMSYYEEEFLPRLDNNIIQNKKAEDYFPEGARTTYLQYLYISNNYYPTGKKSLLDNAKDGSVYSEVHAIYHPVLRSYLEKFGYYDIFLLDSKTGDLLYSVSKEIDFGTSLAYGPYSKTNFGKVVREAMETTDKNFVRLIDFEMYEPSYGAPASFIARPVYEGSVKTGILVFQMPINKVNQILTGDCHWTEDGLGKSGETFIVGSDYCLRSITRGLIENADAYLNQLKVQGYADDTIRQIRKTGTNILLETVKLDSVTKALNGKSGKQVEQNMAGEQCLYTFASLEIADVNWIIMSTLKEDEASEKIERLRNT